MKKNKSRGLEFIKLFYTQCWKAKIWAIAERRWWRGWRYETIIRPVMSYGITVWNDAVYVHPENQRPQIRDQNRASWGTPLRIGLWTTREKTAAHSKPAVTHVTLHRRIKCKTNQQNKQITTHHRNKRHLTGIGNKMTKRSRFGWNSIIIGGQVLMSYAPPPQEGGEFRTPPQKVRCASWISPI